MFRLGCFVFLFLLVQIVYSDTEQDVLEKVAFKKGEKFLVYLYVTNRPEEWTAGNQSVPYVHSGTGDDIYLKSLFFPDVDRLARFDVDDFNNTWYDGWRRGGKEIYVYLQVGQDDASKNITAFKTSRKKYFEGDYVVGSWAAYVVMTNGVPQGIEWDDGCLECADRPEQCISNECAIARSNCEKTPTACAMKVFFAFLGTDNARSTLVSSGDLPSSFKIFSLNNIYEAAAGLPSSNFIF